MRCLAREPFLCASTSLRQRALRPQLKRDPLGAYGQRDMTVSELVPIVLGGATGLAVAAATTQDLLHRRRNRRGLCAYCAELLPIAERFRLEGRILCGRCASRAGRRIARALYALTTFVGVAVVSAPVFAFLIWRRHDPTWWLAFLVLWGVAATMALLIRSVLRSMKAQNVHAAQLERLDALLRLLGLR